MTASGRASDEVVNVFEVDGLFLFKHYFEGPGVFSRLKPYYNNQQYRFEVPPPEFADVRSFLADYDYEFVVVDAIDEFVVVVRKYTSHPENIFKESVIHRGVGDYNCFLMTDRDAVERATRETGARLAEMSLDPPF